MNSNQRRRERRSGSFLGATLVIMRYQNSLPKWTTQDKVVWKEYIKRLDIRELETLYKNMEELREWDWIPYTHETAFMEEVRLRIDINMIT